MRLACIFVPDFPLAAWLRADPELRGTALVVTDGPGPRARIIACSPEAAARGVAAGCSVAQSLAIAADLVLRPVSADAERAAQAALCDVAYSCSPRVEDGGCGTVYLDADGLCAVHGSERELARALRTCAARLGLDVSVGIASSKLAAHLAAREGGGIAVIPPHEEWHFLAPLPVHVLAPSPVLQETFARWGIRRLGDLAALPASAVAARLGPEGALLARRARGEDEAPLVPRPLPLHFEEAAELEYGIESLEPFLFVARALLDRLTERLAVRGLVCGDLRLGLGLMNRGRDERTVAVAVPSNDSKALLTLVRLHLEAHPPSAAVEALRLAAVPERLRPAQLDLFRPNGPAPAQLATTLARLAALCGADRIGVPVVEDSHRPDAYGLAPFGCQVLGVGCRVSGVRDPNRNNTDAWSPTPGPRSDIQHPTPGTQLALRAIRPPRALEVFCDRGRLDFVRLAEVPRGDACSYRCSGRVVIAAGPWRVQGEWWRAESFNRDYYDVQLSDGAVYRIFCDLRQQRWFVEGVYD